ncbi:YhgE/Pip domain-containing protein [Companilactobacillus paralimentarius]|uniref:YhgE/Pip domain-containing protein n=1 Tax=Companilactobacillus paralimentarius TaxID=83526 RepID=UPI00384C697B
MFKSEWKYLINNKKILIVLLAIALIPAIYCYIYLSSMWNTYGKVDHIPVNIVNEDKSVVFNGKEITIGDNLTRSLKDKDTFDFEETSSTKAEQRLRSGKSYMTIIIPKDFSKNATTLLSSHPQKMKINYKINSGQNFIVSKITTGAATNVNQKVSEQVTSTYSKVILKALSGAQNGMVEAGTATNQISSQSPSPQLKAGTQQLSGALLSGAARLNTISKNDQTADHLATPISEHLTDINKVPNNGTGMAPFAIALGIYVAGIALGTMYDNDPHKKPTSAFGWWLSKASIITAVAIVQSVILFFTLTKLNNLQVNSQFDLFGELILGSLLFQSLIFCLSTLLGGVGTWLVSIILVTQVVSSGGLYPMQLVGHFAQTMNQWLPMTYLIDSLRSTISTNLNIQTDILIMIAMIIGFNALSIVKFRFITIHKTLKI